MGLCCDCAEPTPTLRTPTLQTTRFIVPKSVQRAETKVTFGPDLFPFLENERYVFKYSFRAVEGMKLSNRYGTFSHVKRMHVMDLAFRFSALMDLLTPGWKVFE